VVSFKQITFKTDRVYNRPGHNWSRAPLSKLVVCFTLIRSLTKLTLFLTLSQFFVIPFILHEYIRQFSNLCITSFAQI